MRGLNSLGTPFTDITETFVRPLEQRHDNLLCGAHVITRAYQVTSRQDDREQKVNLGTIDKVRRYVAYQLLLKQDDGNLGLFEEDDAFHKAIRKLSQS